ncbi:uncharacterized protein LOC117293144 [Asterias rubens]|uniref:uncharacterized protein LOC117293144 n=1 Tax=Asterias rubens TaxID=7604 RepID=UPI00145545CD|nr:uncharacterized protein LOC117293144 [Asterias rubens]
MQRQLLKDKYPLIPAIKPSKGKHNTALMNPPHTNIKDFVSDDINNFNLELLPYIEKKNTPKRKINTVYDGEQKENFEMVKKKRHSDTKEVLSPNLKNLQQDDVISRSKKRMKENEVLVATAREPPRLTYIAPMPVIGFNQFG